MIAKGPKRIVYDAYFRLDQMGRVKLISNVIDCYATVIILTLNGLNCNLNSRQHRKERSDIYSAKYLIDMQTVGSF